MHGAPKVDDDRAGAATEREDLAGHYETLRAVALAEGTAAAGLGAALLVTQGMPAWMRGWRVYLPAARVPAPPARPAPPSEVVDVLAQMALACA